MTRSRTIRLDLSSVIYDTLEEQAVQNDIGVPDIIRHIIVGWVDENDLRQPGPESARVDSVGTP